jgi:hypothetical protein
VLEEIRVRLAYLALKEIAVGTHFQVNLVLEALTDFLVTRGLRGPAGFDGTRGRKGESGEDGVKGKKFLMCPHKSSVMFPGKIIQRVTIEFIFCFQ